jgi:hypothetical protein
MTVTKSAKIRQHLSTSAPHLRADAARFAGTVIRLDISGTIVHNLKTGRESSANTAATGAMALG